MDTDVDLARYVCLNRSLKSMQWLQQHIGYLADPSIRVNCYMFMQFRYLSEDQARRFEEFLL